MKEISKLQNLIYAENEDRKRNLNTESCYENTHFKHRSIHIPNEILFTSVIKHRLINLFQSRKHERKIE